MDLPADLGAELERFQTGATKALEQHTNRISQFFSELQTRAAQVESLELQNKKLQRELHALFGNGSGFSSPTLPPAADAAISVSGEIAARLSTAPATSSYTHLSEKYNTLVQTTCALRSTNEVLARKCERVDEENAILRSENTELNAKLGRSLETLHALRDRSKYYKGLVKDWHHWAEKKGVVKPRELDLLATPTSGEESRAESEDAADLPPVRRRTTTATISTGDGPGISSLRNVYTARSAQASGFWDEEIHGSIEGEGAQGHETDPGDEEVLQEDVESSPRLPQAGQLHPKPGLLHQSTDKTASLFGSSSAATDHEEHANSKRLKDHIDDSDEEPIIVSERPVRKARKSSGHRASDAALSKETSRSFKVPIKAEPSSSQGPSFGQIRDRSGPETQDLGEVREVARTPRKHQRLSEPVTVETRDASTIKARRVLQTLNQNVSRSPQRLRELSKTSEKNTGSDRGASAIYLLSEDAEEYASRRRSASGSKGVLNSPASTYAKRRLDDLLEGQTPSHEKLLSPQTRRKRRFMELSHPSPSLSESRTKTRRTANPSRRTEIQSVSRSFDPSTEASATARTRSNSPTRSKRHSSEDWPVRPEDEPLRARPVEHLTLEDFRINPAANQGLSYAFTDVVRNHDQRKCLPGCMKPDCCGAKFRKLVKMGGFPTTPMGRVGKGLFDSSPPEEQSGPRGSGAFAKLGLSNQDARIIQEYLGDAGTLSHLERMTPSEREDVLIDAKAKKLSDMYGKHRHLHERAKSPPGFWRTDMPDSQEEERDRGEAQKMVRTKVEERYREAMRKGGLWKFADD